VGWRCCTEFFLPSLEQLLRDGTKFSSVRCSRGFSWHVWGNLVPRGRETKLVAIYILRVGTWDEKSEA
jgi:hypothetical protein